MSDIFLASLSPLLAASIQPLAENVTCLIVWSQGCSPNGAWGREILCPEHQDRYFDREANAAYKAKLERSQIPIEYLKYKIDTSPINDLQQGLVSDIRNAITEENGKLRRGLILSGATGIGKTNLAVELALEEMRKHGTQVYYSLVSASYKALEGGINHDETHLQKLCTAPLLIWDDLGKGKNAVSEHRREVLAHVIETRKASGLHTFITSNLTKEEMANNIKDDAIMDRLSDIRSYLYSELHGESARAKSNQ